jgi:peptidoglycan/xylan/chitin deacetylase (PgdA/CDA1 family)
MPRLFPKLLNKGHALCLALLAGLAVLGLAACASASAAGPTALPTVRVVSVGSSPTPAASQPPASEQIPTAGATPVDSTTVPGPLPTAILPPDATPAPTQPESQPTPDALGATRPVRLPIFMYHYIEPWPADADEIRQGLTVRPEDFAAQLAYLHDNGYVTVSLYDLADAMALGRPLPDKAVVLTFDDGYRSLLDYALPMMQEYDFAGTIFVITQLMDDELPEYLTWTQAELLYAQGWKIEPHTKTHDQLGGRGRDFQLYQMLGSIQTVEAHIGRAPRFFAYPSGSYDELSVQLAEELHLWGAVTVGFGRVHQWNRRYELGRVRVSGTADLTDFINSLEGELEP